LFNILATLKHHPDAVKIAINGQAGLFFKRPCKAIKGQHRPHGTTELYKFGGMGGQGTWVMQSGLLAFSGLLST